MPEETIDKSMYVISESRVSGLKELKYSESSVQFFPSPYRELIIASPGFVLLFVDNYEELEENPYQRIGLYDVSANKWNVPPPLKYTHAEELKRVTFMCDLLGYHSMSSFPEAIHF